MNSNPDNGELTAALEKLRAAAQRLPGWDKTPDAHPEAKLEAVSNPLDSGRLPAVASPRPPRRKRKIKRVNNRQLPVGDRE